MEKHQHHLPVLALISRFFVAVWWTWVPLAFGENNGFRTVKLGVTTKGLFVKSSSFWFCLGQGLERKGQAHPCNLTLISFANQISVVQNGEGLWKFRLLAVATWASVRVTNAMTGNANDDMLQNNYVRPNDPEAPYACFLKAQSTFGHVFGIRILAS